MLIISAIVKLKRAANIQATADVVMKQIFKVMFTGMCT